MPGLRSVAGFERGAPEKGVASQAGLIPASSICCSLLAFIHFDSVNKSNDSTNSLLVECVVLHLRTLANRVKGLPRHALERCEFTCDALHELS